MTQRFRSPRFAISSLSIVAILIGVIGFSEGPGTVLAAQKTRTQKSSGSRKGKSKQKGKKPPVSKIPRGQNKPRPDVAKVDAALAYKVKSSATRIDKFITDGFAKHRVTPELSSSDSQFLRRIYLDITGTIPDLRQTERFLSSSRSDKREKLIDDLLNSPGYVSHHYNYFGNILRLTDRPNNNHWGSLTRNG